MRLLLVCNKFPYPPRDGGSLATGNMIRGLVETGNCVDLLAMNTSKHFSVNGISKIDVEGINIVKDVFVDNPVSYSGLVYNLLFSSKPYNAMRFIDSRFNRELAGMLKKNHYDIVQLEGLFILPFTRMIRTHTDAKIVYRAHNIEHKIWESYYRRQKSGVRKWYSGLLYRRMKRFEQDCINLYDLLVTFTNADLKKLNSMGNVKAAHIAPFGMYPGEFPASGFEPDGDFCLQYIGALDWMPNIDSLDWFIERVWSVIKKKYPGLIFRVAGRNAKPRYIKKLAGAGIEFCGEIENSREFLSKPGIFIAPLFAGSGIRVKIIEAMFMQKPIITTSFALSGIPACHGNDILVANEEFSFVDSIEKLLAEREFAGRLGANARELALRKFDNRMIMGAIVEFYENYLL